VKKRTWGIRCKWSELERVQLELDRQKGLSLHLLKHDTCPDSSGFGLLSGPGRKKILDLKVQLPTIEQRRICANQLPTIDQRMITYAFQISCMIIMCFIKIRMYCDYHVAALFASKNRSSRWSIEFRFIDLIDNLRLSDVLPCIEVIFRIHRLIGIWTYCHSVTSRMLRLGYRILTLINLIDSLVAEINVSLSAFARTLVYCSSSPSSRNSAPLTQPLCLSLDLTWWLEQALSLLQQACPITQL